jgi:hypothetical protein
VFSAVASLDRLVDLRRSLALLMLGPKTTKLLGRSGTLLRLWLPAFSRLDVGSVRVEDDGWCTGWSCDAAPKQWLSRCSGDKAGRSRCPAELWRASLFCSSRGRPSWAPVECRFRSIRAFGERDTELERVSDFELSLERRLVDESPSLSLEAAEKLNSRSSDAGSSLPVQGYIDEDR